MRMQVAGTDDDHNIGRLESPVGKRNHQTRKYNRTQSPVARPADQRRLCCAAGRHHFPD
jgi:hypothetical protein